jgi:hypothetical protein
VSSELVRSVGEDLRHLRETLNTDVTDAALRRSSTLLRRLAVQGDYGKAWRWLGLKREPVVRAPQPDDVLGRISARRLVYASPVGAHLLGGQVGQILIPKPLYELPPVDK